MKILETNFGFIFVGDGIKLSENCEGPKWILTLIFIDLFSSIYLLMIAFQMQSSVINELILNSFSMWSSAIPMSLLA
jgi:hypothetical protein